ncbi:hypothetical protein FOZ63_001710 [Perkinsus olseni]|uniref:Uncharacterized protein n=1 Tax=Perkinsus olseni TaxID=32597 RepID=A0A7J6PVA5_PEROL|nr:hypothetical protein FOZ62_008966 [Perkinsus olseni]KAF4751481.1 hypothetical protein FOZ63_001710 [Perkinsus olseni]
MPLRSIVVLFSLASLAHGTGKNKAPAPPPPPPTKTPTKSNVRYRSFQIDYGDFVYRSKSGPRVTMILNITKDGRGMFEIGCGGSPFRDGWFKLREVDDDPQHEHLHPYKPGDSHHQRWLERVRGACPHLNVFDEDLDSFYINENGNAETMLADENIVLKRQWLPFNPGRYSSNSSVSDFRLNYDVFPHGSVNVNLGCSAEDGHSEGYTGWVSFRLWRGRPGKPYRLIPTSHGDTVRKLFNSFAVACPLWEDSFEEDDFMLVRFATPDMMYAFGMFEYDRLYRSPWPQ